MTIKGEEESAASAQTQAAPERGEKDVSASEQSRPPLRNRAPANVHELLTEEIKFRSTRANQLLHNCLTGKVIFIIEGNGKSYLIDWSGDKLEAGPTTDSEADCVITVNEQNLMKIATGELNPQVAMLSDKIKVTGKLGLAVYIFNLIGARSLML